MRMINVNEDEDEDEDDIQIGYIPTNYLQQLKASESVMQVIALADYNEEGENLLHFRQGEILTVVDGDDMWLEGCTENGEQGWFPAEYVKRIHASDE